MPLEQNTMPHSSGHEPTHYSPAATAYARSLLDLANESKQAEAIGAELKQLKVILDANPTFKEILANPSIGVQEREQLIDSIFRKNVSPLIFNTLGVMNQHGRMALVAEMAGAYDDLLGEQLGKVDVDLTVVQKLTPEQLNRAKELLSGALKREVVLHEYENPDIIGGAVVRVGDKLIDASVKYQLSAIREQMLAAAPK
jgi:F-type H+-transporting ATPase subunit delta